MMFRRAYSSGFTQRPDHHRDGRLLGAGDRLLGHPWKGAQPPGLGAPRGADERPHPRNPYTYLYPEPGQENPDFWVSPDAAAPRQPSAS